GLGLERNDTKITYYSAKHTYISVPPIPIFLPPGLHVHIVTPVEYKKTEKSWYYVKDETKFSKKKITVTAVKRSGSASNAGYPFGKGLFKGIKDWPEIRTIAAAAYYNTKGPGFRIAKETKIKETIEAFDDSERSGNRGGWKAHLVPAGLGTRH
ncbi:hypothetical protein KJ633_01500, partial [bacterium]|nr:hypothetical protein [bacterium]